MGRGTVEAITGLVETLNRAREFVTNPRPSGEALGVVHDGMRAGCDVASAVPGRIRGFTGIGLSLGYVCSPYWNDQGYSSPTLGRVTKITVRMESLGFSCENVVSTPEVSWPGTHEGITIATPATPPTGCIPQGNIGNGFILTDSNGDQLTAATGAGNRQPAEIVSIEITDDPLPGPDPAPDPGPEFDPFPDPDNPSLPGWEWDDFADDPDLGPGTPTPDGDEPGECCTFINRVLPPVQLPTGGGMVTAPDGEVIIGAALVLTNIPVPTPGFPTRPFETAVAGGAAFFPRIGYASFQTLDGSSIGPFNIQLEQQNFPVPGFLDAVSVRVDLPTGVESTVQLTTRQVQESFEP